MTRKWNEVRGTFSPAEEALIRQKGADYEKVIAFYAVESDPTLRELAETDPEGYLRRKQANGESEPFLSPQ